MDVAPQMTTPGAQGRVGEDGEQIQGGKWNTLAKRATTGVLLAPQSQHFPSQPHNLSFINPTFLLGSPGTLVNGASLSFTVTPDSNSLAYCGHRHMHTQ